MKKITIFWVFLLLIFSTILVSAQSSRSAEDINREISDLEKKLSETQTRGTTLANQISYMNNQIRLTTLKISETQGKINQLGGEITSLSTKIGRLEESLGDLSKVLLERIAMTYKKGYTPGLYFLFSSEGFSDFLSRVKYLSIVQAHDKKLMYQMQETKDNYTDQKEVREEKKKEQEQLKRQLESQKQTLAQQTKDKQTLLEVTRNDERRYQDLLAAARAEKQALEGAMAQALALLKNGSPINEGDQIALMGNSGAPYCSTGTHLHFEIRKNDVPQNPAGYLKNIAVSYDSGPVGRMSFSGDWNWPMESPKITQEYGMSYWARLGWYSGGSHTGIDMTASSSVIKAPRKGTLYKGAASCRGVGMNYVAIDHGDGLISWYWHVQ